MSSVNNVMIIAYVNGHVFPDPNMEDSIQFTSRGAPCHFNVCEGITFQGLSEAIVENVDVGVDFFVKRVRYRCPLKVLEDGSVRYKSANIKHDENMCLMFQYYRRFKRYVHDIELCIDIEVVVPRFVSNDECQQEGEEEEQQSSFYPDSQHHIDNVNANTGDVVERSNFPEWMEFEYNSEEDEDYHVQYDSDDSSSDEEDTEDEGESSASQIQVPYEPPPLMRTLDMNAMYAYEFPEYVDVGPQYVEGGEFEVGMQFRDRDAAEEAIKRFSISRSVDYRVTESILRSTLHCKCVYFGERCSWRVRVSYRKKKGVWEITKYNGSHTCMEDVVLHDHPKLDSKMIAKLIQDMVGEDATIKVKVIIKAMESQFGFRPTYRKAWLAKKKAIENIFGNWEQSYNDLPKWLTALIKIDHGSVCHLQVGPVYNKDVLIPSARTFQRVFWTFRSCVEGFQYCKPLIQIDGTHLYGKYKGTLLVAVSQDGARNILPIGFALVEGETTEAWLYFLNNLRKHVVFRDGVGLISDRHKSIIEAIRQSEGQWEPPRAYPMFCLRHLAANFLRKFKNRYLHKLVVNMGYARTEGKFNQVYMQLHEHGTKYTEWLDKIDREKWTLAWDGGRRYGHMTTNLVECINSTLKVARNLPITALVQTTYWRCTELVATKWDELNAQMVGGNKFSQRIIDDIKEKGREGARFTVVTHSRSNQSFTVRDNRNSDQFAVELLRRYCDCGSFQVERYPCSHALACIAKLNVRWHGYVDDIYKLENICKVWARPFTPIGHPDTWPRYNGYTLCANEQMLRKTLGRPKSTRYLNEMDGPAMRRQKRCSLCRNYGHKRSQCPNITS